MSIELKDISRSNFDAVLKLDVDESQRGFVAPNVKSIAESKVYDIFYPRAIYSKESKNELVGFLMYGQDDGKTDDVWIIRFMIDKAYQGKGYGKAAMIFVINEMKDRYNMDKIFLSFEPENTLAQKHTKGLVLLIQAE
jgi:diamine N-acetyltransferase